MCSSDLERATLFHLESSHLAEMLAERAYVDGRNVVWDATMADEGNTRRRMNDLRAHGYGVDGVFVHVPVQTSISRIRARYREAQRQWMQDHGMGGRPVPEHLVLQSERPGGRSANLEVFERLQPEFDRWTLYDNAGMAPRLISRS